MSKSIYSLVLMDNLVNEVDKLAYISGTSRSNMVNRILAEYLSMSTPEVQIQNIFSRMEELISSYRGLITTANPSEKAISMKSVLSYKYNPTVRYNVVLYPRTGDTFGELRVQFRTQNAALLDTVTQFFILWAKLEKAYRKNDTIIIKISDGKLTRELNTLSGSSHEYLADATAKYIELFDRALKLFFEYRANYQLAIRQVEELYRKYLSENIKEGLI